MYPPRTRSVPPAPRCCRTSECSGGRRPRSALSVTSLSAVVVAAYHGVSAAMPLDLPPSGQNPIVFGNAADRPFNPTPVFCHCQFSRSRMHAAKFRATLPHLTTLPVGCTRLGDPAASREMCLRVSPCFRIFPTSSFFSTCCSCCSCYCRGVQTASSRATTIPFPPRTARVPTIVLSSQGFSSCCTC